jgi:hypothetical protein
MEKLLFIGRLEKRTKLWSRYLSKDVDDWTSKTTKTKRHSIYALRGRKSFQIIFSKSLQIKQLMKHKTKGST